MTDDIYEVEHRDYIGFLDRLKTNCYTEQQHQIDDFNYQIIKISKLTHNILCKKKMTLDKEKQYVEIEKYYIINLPEAEELREPKRKLHIELKTKDQLQAFFKILSECGKK